MNIGPDNASLEKHKSQTEHNESTEKNDVLTREMTMASVDIENKRAYKSDDSDGKVEWTARTVAAFVFLAAMYTGKIYSTPSLQPDHQLRAGSGSQIILYFIGGSLLFIEPDLHVTTQSAWLPVSFNLAIAAVAPYCGYLQDVFGKRNIALMGAALACVGIGKFNSFFADPISKSC